MFKARQIDCGFLLNNLVSMHEQQQCLNKKRQKGKRAEKSEKPFAPEI